MFILDFTGWCSEPGVLKIFGVIKTIINVVRWVVPIGLIIFTTIDIVRNVLNPENKDAMKTITNRLIAAIIVFFLPIMIGWIMNLVDIGLGEGEGYNYNISECWRNS